MCELHGMKILDSEREEFVLNTVKNIFFVQEKFIFPLGSHMWKKLIGNKMFPLVKHSMCEPRGRNIFKENNVCLG